jgi:hypothetical protein
MTAEETSLIAQSAKAEENKEQIIQAKLNVAAKRGGKWAGRVKEYMKEYAKEYNQRPEIKARIKERHSRPEWIAANKEYLSRPEVKERRRAAGRKTQQRQIAKDKHRARQQRPEVKSKARIALLNRKYGLTKDEYDSMFSKQGMACASCGTGAWGAKGPHVDHNHRTGKIRGILCTRCNSAAGLLDDDYAKAFLLCNYLKRDGGQE